MTTATEFSQTAERPMDTGDVDLTRLHYDPLHAITPLPWRTTERIALALLGVCFAAGVVMLWVGW